MILYPTPASALTTITGTPHSTAAMLTVITIPMPQTIIPTRITRLNAAAWIISPGMNKN